MYRASSSSESDISSTTDYYTAHFDSLDTQNKESQESNGQASKNGYKKASERPPAIVAKRNARERSRVQMVNDAFVILKKHLPTLKHRSKRVSKLKILRATLAYMTYLQDLLEADHHITMMRQCQQYYAGRCLTREDGTGGDMGGHVTNYNPEPPIPEPLAQAHYHHATIDQGNQDAWYRSADAYY